MGNKSGSRYIYTMFKLKYQKGGKKKIAHTRTHSVHIICIRPNKIDERKSEMNNDDASSFLNNVQVSENLQ